MPSHQPTTNHSQQPAQALTPKPVYRDIYKARRPEIVTLMYHDVVSHSAHEESGFATADAALYKLDRLQFERHIAAIARDVRQHPILVTDLLAAELNDNIFQRAADQPLDWMMTFDDGGASAYEYIADRLEDFGWRGHFFISTDYIGTRGFMSRSQIRELHQRGHVIGTHSCSHPLRMADCKLEEIEREWTESSKALADVLGESVTIASLPGGQYSREVAGAAALAGIEVLFTSEPTTKSSIVTGCLVIGRYSIQRWMEAEIAAALARKQWLPCLRQRVWWDTKKITKAIGGKTYLKLRASLAQWTDAGTEPTRVVAELVTTVSEEPTNAD